MLKMNKTDFSDKELTISAGITVASSLLSIIGGLLIIWSYSRITETQNRVRDLLVALTIADICIAFGNGVGGVQFYYLDSKQSLSSNAVCVGQSFITTSFSISSFLWILSIAMYLFRCVWIQEDPLLTRKTMKLIHVIVWGIPGVITLTAYLYDKLGNGTYSINGVWCWLKVPVDTKWGLFWMLVTGKGWEVITYVVIAILYIMMKIKTYRQGRRFNRNVLQWNQISNELRREDEIYCISCLIIYCLRMWGIIRLVLGLVRTDIPFNNYCYDHVIKQALLFLHSYGDSAQAFWNFILFCLCDKTVRTHVKLAFCRRKLNRLGENIKQNNERTSFF
ncbi:G-protein coupled receptor 157-like [Mytilus galloprovincialis]|uniref:G-protein coupled receptor 157-like n=1 Tax=Mytilus galloprovincialis TaxID=29158 RepID=UPI003F7C8FFD